MYTHAYININISGTRLTQSRSRAARKHLLHIYNIYIYIASACLTKRQEKKTGTYSRVLTSSLSLSKRTADNQQRGQKKRNLARKQASAREKKKTGTELEEVRVLLSHAPPTTKTKTKKKGTQRAARRLCAREQNRGEKSQEPTAQAGVAIKQKKKEPGASKRLLEEKQKKQKKTNRNLGQQASACRAWHPPQRGSKACSSACRPLRLLLPPPPCPPSQAEEAEEAEWA